jgi:DNA-binding NtrC family response regulator
MAGEEHVSDPSERAAFGELLGSSRVMRSLFAEAARLAQGDASVMIAGEPGTGKDVLARSLHAHSPRRSGPFITFDCGTIAPAALESELFGRAEASTGGRVGALELASGGTLLLADVAELPPALQPLLDAALRERTFKRSGGERVLALNVRVVSATRRRLTREAERGRFLPALAEQLGQSELALPALRDRREDIPLLAGRFLAGLDRGAELTLTQEALDALSLHDWPGNVRELRNVVERLFYAAQAGSAGARRVAALLLSGELPGRERRPAAPLLEPQTFEPGTSYREERARFEAAFEQRYVAWLLERHDGNVSAAARAADMDRKYLDKLARKHALKSRS